jgi:ribonuclease D
MSRVLIDNSMALEAALNALGGTPWLALDTEFLRERTYYPKLCLLQIGAPHADYFVDTLVCSDSARLSEFLADTRQIKIIHAVRQDLEALTHAGICPVQPIFDTQVAAALIGHPDQVAYAWLVQHYCAVTLDKSQTRTDWTQRPLSPAQLAYAQDDVKYLGTLYEILRQALEDANKLEWLWEETAGVAEAIREAELPTEAWRRVRGIGTLSARGLVRGKALAHWREMTAQHLDCPRGWLLKDEAVLAMAAQSSLSMTTLGKLDGIAPATLRRHGEAMLTILEAAEEEPDLDHPHWRLSAEGTRLLGELQEVVRLCAADVQASATLIASRKDLEALILGAPSRRLLRGWRAALLGSTLEAKVAEYPLEARRQVVHPR